MSGVRRVWEAIRWIYGLFFVAIGSAILLSVTTGLFPPPTQRTPQAQAFMDALAASGFMDPLLGVSFLLGGSMLLVRRTIPLGLAVIAPSVTVILLFHLTLSGEIFWGALVAGVLGALIWRHRDGFRCLWTYHLAPDDNV